MVHRCLCIYVYMAILPYNYPRRGGFFNLDMTVFFLLFLNTGQEIPCSGRAEHVYQRHTAPSAPLLVTSAWFDWLKTNHPSDVAHWPALQPTGAKDLFMVTAITAYISWPSEPDLLALPLSESIRKSSGSAWLAQTSDLPWRIRSIQGGKNKVPLQLVKQRYF